MTRVLGISGSPIRNSNTDRLIKLIMETIGLEYEFIKLSDSVIRPCFACKRCVKDNICKVQDDFPPLAEKIKKARALIIGAYIPYGQIDGFTKALLERFWSLRHVNNLLKGKLCATIVTGIDPNNVQQVSKALAAELQTYERMELVGQITVNGNVPCASCGKGDNCEMSGLKLMYGPNVKASDMKYVTVESQEEVLESAKKIGLSVREKLL